MTDKLLQSWWMDNKSSESFQMYPLCMDGRYYACIVVTLKGVSNDTHFLLVCIWIWSDVVGARQFLSWHCIDGENSISGIVRWRMICTCLKSKLCKLLVHTWRSVDLQFLFPLCTVWKFLPSLHRFSRICTSSWWGQNIRVPPTYLSHTVSFSSDLSITISAIYSIYIYHY